LIRDNDGRVGTIQRKTHALPRGRCRYPCRYPTFNRQATFSRIFKERDTCSEACLNVSHAAPNLDGLPLLFDPDPENCVRRKLVNCFQIAAVETDIGGSCGLLSSRDWFCDNCASDKRVARHGSFLREARPDFNIAMPNNPRSDFWLHIGFLHWNSQK
jgi:hypothetical protein